MFHVLLCSITGCHPFIPLDEQRGMHNAAVEVAQRRISQRSVPLREAEGVHVAQNAEWRLSNIPQEIPALASRLTPVQGGVSNTIYRLHSTQRKEQRSC